MAGFKPLNQERYGKDSAFVNPSESADIAIYRQVRAVFILCLSDGNWTERVRYIPVPSNLAAESVPAYLMNNVDDLSAPAGTTVKFSAVRTWDYMPESMEEV